MDFVLEFAPKESERAYAVRILHLIELQNKFLKFERWRCAEQID